MALTSPQAVPPQVEPPAPTLTDSPPDSVRANSDHFSNTNPAQDSPGISRWRRTSPKDVHHFFVRSGDKIVCDVCR